MQDESGRDGAHGRERNPSLVSTNPQPYDTIGRAYYGGVRFKF